MGANTKIEWADHSFNPWLGCQKVGPGCDHCYAEAWAKRSGLVQWGPDAERRMTSDATWKEPLKWNEEARAAGRRATVMCASLCDVFDKQAPQGGRERLWELVKATPWLFWLPITKRIGNVPEMLPKGWGDGWANVGLIITVVNQEEADRDIPKLLKVPVNMRGLSAEPLLGPLRLRKHIMGFNAGYPARCLCGHGHGFTRCPNTGGVSRRCHVRECDCTDFRRAAGDGLHLVMTGGETGPGARPVNFDWYRWLLADCQATGTAFFLKHCGEWIGASESSGASLEDARALRDRGEIGKLHEFGDGQFSIRVGKRAAGRQLDGRTWDQMPAVIHA